MEDTPAEDGSQPKTDEMLEQLYTCINRLRPLDRLLVSLHLEGNDGRQVAAVMGILEGNVRVKLHRIKAELKELWKEKGYES